MLDNGFYFFISVKFQATTHALPSTPRCAKNREMVWMGLAEFRDLIHCCGRYSMILVDEYSDSFYPRPSRKIA